MDLLQNTDQHRTFGPFLAIADGITPIDDLTVTGVTWVLTRDYDDGTASTHTTGSCSATGNADWELVAVGHGGLYHLHIPAASINWVGEGMIELFDTDVCCPDWRPITVKPANVLGAERGTDYQKVDVETIKTRAVTDVGSGQTVALGTSLPPTAVAVRQEMDANSTKLANLDATISSRHASGAAVAKSPATLDWSADVSNKPTIGTSTVTTSDVLAQCGAALTQYDSNGGVAKESSITTVLARLGAWAGSGLNTVLGAFMAMMRKDATVPSDIGGTFLPSTDSVEAIRDRGDAAWTTGAASGEGAYTGTLTINYGSTGLEGVVVNATRGGLLIATGTTDASGQITDWVFAANTYTLAVRLDGYQPATSTVVVTGDGWAKTISLTSISVTTSDPGFVTGYLYCYDESGAVESGVEVLLRLKSTASTTTGTIMKTASRTSTSSALGLVTFTNLLPGATYMIRRGDRDTWNSNSDGAYHLSGPSPLWKLFTVPSTQTTNYAIPSLWGSE